MRKLKHRRQRREDQAREITKYEHCQGHGVLSGVAQGATRPVRSTALPNLEQKVDAAALVPHIVAQFLANDRAIQKIERTSVSESGDSKLDRVHGTGTADRRRACMSRRRMVSNDEEPTAPWRRNIPTAVCPTERVVPAPGSHLFFPCAARTGDASIIAAGGRGR